MPVWKPSLGYSEQDARLGQGESSFVSRYYDVALVLLTGPWIPIIMNWNMIISVFIIVVIKVAGVTVFLLYCEYSCEPSPASFLSECQTEYHGSVPMFLHIVLPHSIRHRGRV